MIVTTNILAAPLAWVVSLLDLYILLILIRLVASKLNGLAASRLCQNLQPLTDSVWRRVNRILSARRATPAWVSWLAAITLLLIVRYALASAIMALATHGALQ